MSTYSFSEEAVANAIDAAKKTHESNTFLAAGESPSLDSKACMLVSAECITVTIENHSVCINLPLGLGKHCISVPISIPSGTAGKACLDICTTWGIPTGVKVSIIVAGVTVVSQSFGKC